MVGERNSAHPGHICIDEGCFVSTTHYPLTWGLIVILIDRKKSATLRPNEGWAQNDSSTGSTSEPALHKQLFNLHCAIDIAMCVQLHQLKVLSVANQQLCPLQLQGFIYR